MLHGFRIRVPGDVDPVVLVERFHAAQDLRARLGITPRIWSDQVAAVAADRYWRKELTRAVSARRGLRAVVLSYVEGGADLLLIARRDRLDRRTLALLAEQLTLGGVFALADQDLPVPPNEAPIVPAWGAGESLQAGGFGEYELSIDGAPTIDAMLVWMAALGIVLSRYDNTDTPAIGFRSLPGAEGAERGGVVSLPIVATPVQLIAGLRAAVTDPGQPSGQVSVGIVLDPAGTRMDYVPYPIPVFPLTLSAERNAVGDYSLRWRYRSNSFGAERVRQLAGHVATVHNLILRHPGRDVREIDMLTEAEQRRIIGAGRGAPAVVRGHRRIDAVFRARVRENPDAVAVSMNGQELTYQELDSRSDRLARALAAAGVGAGDHVGVCLERSLDLVLCLLAVVKAGAAYVPLDPDYPAGRLTYIADNADLAVAVADADVADIFARVLTLDELEAAATDSSSTLESVSTEATDTAYIIYTSGSTGRPKGVAVSHANVVGLIDATADDFGLRATDTWTMFHSAAFDFSVWEIWGCLLTGARLVVVPYWVSRSPVEFLGLLEKNRVSVLSQTPSAFAQLINAAAERSTALSTRLVILGGEPLDTRMVLRWFDIRPETTCRVVNMYGITETTVHVTAHTVTRRAAVAGSRSVGRPLPGWHVYVMDRAGRPLPFDVPGEIWVGGVGVSKGYVNATGDEGARFAADPFADGVVYRSGDWGQLTADGQLVHRGRIDSQVKVRGFRIELEEIRSVLLADPVVRAAAVVVRHNDIEDAATARIDAYAVLRGAGDAGTLRRNLSERLPTYMMPATISVLDELPLTVNGKVDTARLPAPRLSSTRASEAPRPQLDSSMIARLAELWSEMFGAPVAPDDDFFELGGNSLLAVRLLADLGEATLTVADLYRHPTIRRLAGLLDAAAVAPTG